MVPGPSAWGWLLHYHTLLPIHIYSDSAGILESRILNFSQKE